MGKKRDRDRKTDRQKTDRKKTDRPTDEVRTNLEKVSHPCKKHTASCSIHKELLKKISLLGTNTKEKQARTQQIP